MLQSEMCLPHFSSDYAAVRPHGAQNSRLAACN